MININLLPELPNKKSFDMGYKGLTRIETDDELSLYTDPFSSEPLYMLKEANGDLWIFSDFQDFQKKHEFNCGIDKAGFWEIIILGTSLGTRTLYDNIIQLPSASQLKINKKDGSCKIERYWDFNIAESPEISSLSRAADKLHEIMLDIFNGIDSEKQYYMGLSGGMDSRFSLGYLSNVLSRDKLKLFTYGFNKHILEYKYADSAAKALGFEGSSFHKLDAKVYRDALNYLPRAAAGQISIAHCHILSYFVNNNCPGSIQISNYYSDAVFGYSASAQKTGIEKNPYVERLRSMKFIDADTAEIIYNDIMQVCAGFQESGNFSSLGEYIYITERNPKFHMRLAKIQDGFIKTISPYADLNLLKYMISVPLKYREQKILMDEVFRKFHPDLSGNKINQLSSRFQPRFAKGGEWGHFRLLNLANGLLRAGTRGRIQLLNKYQTEEHERLLYTSFYDDLKNATSNFYRLGLINKDAKAYYDKLPVRAVDAESRFSLISLDKLTGSKTKS